MRTSFVGLLALGLLLAACGGQPAASPTSAPAPAPAASATDAPATASATDAPAAAPTGGGTIVLMTHDSFNVSAEVLRAFERQEGVTVQVLRSGDAGSALNKAILSKGSPLADVFFGVDNTFLSRALEADIFEPYAAPALAAVPGHLKLDPGNRLLPIDYGYVSVNYDKAYMEQNRVQPPQTLEELTRPEWKGKLVVENPATSSPGLAFLLATVGRFGAEGDYTWREYWRDLRANDVLVAEGWEDAYTVQFSGSSGKGPRPLVVSYASSPPVEVLFSEGKLQSPPTGVMLDGSFLQIEFAGILRGTQRRAQAERLIDFLLSRPFQEDVPLQMFVYPVLPDATLPDLFRQFAQVPDSPITVPPEQIQRQRDQWIDEWTAIVQR